jgi:hypothetical protein
MRLRSLVLLVGLLALTSGACESSESKLLRPAEAVVATASLSTNGSLEGDIIVSGARTTS